MLNAETPEIVSLRYAELPPRDGQSNRNDLWEKAYPDASAPVSKPDASALGRGSNPSVQRYEFAAGTGVLSQETLDDHGPVGGSVSGSDGERAGEENPSDPASAILDEELVQQLLVAESARAEERGRSKGFEMGFASGREEAARQLQGERERLCSQAVALTESFSSSRETYFHRLEQEAVRLALSIAARILRREAETDSLLLIGAVRVALSQLALSTSVRLLVPRQDVSLWEEAIASIPGLHLRPLVLGGPQMKPGECRMETDLGSADMGLWQQLTEIERSFFAKTESPGEISGVDGSEAHPGEAMASSVSTAIGGATDDKVSCGEPLAERASGDQGKDTRID